ncbi:MAG: chromosome partitioning protein ParB [Pseudomonadota bacterium]|nr:chromosome partitioning protein ParB [Pseudomonadota bacterium]
MATRRLLTEAEKQVVRAHQIEPDGSLRCFISGDLIGEGDEVEYDHIQPWSKDGETSISNIRITLKDLNRRKSDQSLYEVRDNIRLERLFEAKQNDIRLQDIFKLKDVVRRNIFASVNGSTIRVDDGTAPLEFPLFHDAILGVSYFYGRIPIPWIENDDQEGLQPRVIDFKRLIAIRDHLKTHPQLAPSIGRLLGGRLKLFDGQHKLAAQVLNNQKDVDIKVYVSPQDAESAKRLFDSLMITNLDAHSKLKQIPFYTSTMLARLSVIHREYLDEFIAQRAPETHTEISFIGFLVSQKGLSQSEAKDILRGAIRNSALGASSLQAHIAKASKDAGYPITVDLLSKTIFRSTLNLEPSSARFNSEQDYRSAETANFTVVADLLVQETGLRNWVANKKGTSLTNEQLKARRIWHKGSVLTWSPYLKSILIFALHIMTSAERDAMLYRQPITDKEKEIIRVCLERLFSHPMWDAPEPTIDSLLVSAQKQDALFDGKGLTEKYVISGA